MEYVMSAMQNPAYELWRGKACRPDWLSWVGWIVPWVFSDAGLHDWRECCRCFISKVDHCMEKEAAKTNWKH